MGPSPAALAPARTPLTPAHWAIIFTASLGGFLEVLDTSIFNVALTSIQSHLGATLAEVGWVVTGYAMANVVILPLTAWLGNGFGRRGYFVFSLAGFTLASVLCGLAPNLPLLVTGRIIQGLLGGGLLAKSQAILFETIPKDRQGFAQAVFGLGIISGPALGPTVGGYLTDLLSWRWIFLINLPFGILAVMMALRALPPDQKKPLPSLASVDWQGILLLILGLGSLQIVLEQGQQYAWFEDRGIVALTITALLSCPAFIWWELRHPNPGRAAQGAATPQLGGRQRGFNDRRDWPLWHGFSDPDLCPGCAALHGDPNRFTHVARGPGLRCYHAHVE